MRWYFLFDVLRQAIILIWENARVSRRVNITDTKGRNIMIGVRRLVSLLAGLIIFCSVNMSLAQTITIGNLLEQSEYQTPYYIVDSGVPGKTVMIVGGTHGSEQGGWEAVSLLQSEYSRSVRKVDKGRLIIIPKANIKGVTHFVRLMDRDDLNRCYPGDENGSPAERLAYQITSIMQTYQVEAVIDCHESIKYAKSGGLGNSIIASFGPARALAKGAVTHINTHTQPRSAIHRWRVGGYPIKGSTAWQAGQFQRYGFTIETCVKDKLAERIAQQILTIEYLLAHEM